MARYNLDELLRQVSGPNPPAPAGEPGTPGADGEPGAPGEDGAAATIAIGSVSTLSPGSSATVTNSGSSSAAVFDFGIPRGDTGSGGSGIFDEGEDDPNDLVFTETPPNGSIYIQTDVGAWMYFSFFSPHWHQFVS